MKNRVSVILLCLCFAFANAQSLVSVGTGSYAEYAPSYKCRTDEHGGDRSRFMETRKIYLTQNAENKPVPSNDWWTDILTTQYSGNLWVYPQMAKAESYGVSISFPKDWEATGHEIKWNSTIQISAKKFKPACAKVDTWNDWGFVFVENDGVKEMKVTVAQGIPFIFIETKNAQLQIAAQNATCYNSNGVVQTLPYIGNALAIQIENDVYGIYAPTGTTFSFEDGKITLNSAAQSYISVGVLPSQVQLAEFEQYAYVVPRNTTVSWNYNAATGKVQTLWNLTTENLRGAAQNAVLQGFIPHHYKNSEHNLNFTSYEYQTPRGTMKMAVGNSFSISYKFNGILPYFAAPQELIDLQNPYNRARMVEMIAQYANQGTFGADTYWGGKGLTQMALYMTFARELGETVLFEKCKNRLKETLVNWLTYTPGELQFFFGMNTHWGALVGFDTSYDSETFNDHHFHYGYFTYAAALLALFDDDFRTNYGEMITLVAKDYANWDKNDTRFPFLRTFTPYEGHSYAGGMGNNGNGQESSSEAMQGWGGLYLLGVALGNDQMRDAGIFGWTVEARGTAEYWFDRNRENIDYQRYTSPYNSNLTSQGVGWWTWFSGDPVWMHSIQWMPISPCLKYLYEDLDFARWDYTTMWNGKEVGDWTTQQGLPSSLSYESGLGNVVLSYLQIFDADSAAAVFDRAWNANMPLAKNADTGGISYFVTHSHRSYGDICWDIYGDIPTTTVYQKNGNRTYVVYNAENQEKTVNFYQNEMLIKTIKVPAKKLTVYQTDPILSSIKINEIVPNTVLPNTTQQLDAQLFDQYGATMGGEVTWLVLENGSITQNGLFTAGTTLGVHARVVATNGNLKDTITLKINNLPVLQTAEIIPNLQYLEKGKTVNYTLQAIDQYNEPFEVTPDWEIIKSNNTVENSTNSKNYLFNKNEIGIYTIKAKVGTQEFTTEVYLAPPFANIALNKTTQASSYENAGTVKENVNDGDLATRWGSQHSDNQWIRVDLGTVAYISHVTLVWEAAYASLYEIQISDNGSAWTTIETIDGHGGAETTVINASARYVRMLGLQRASPYGYSIYEFQVFGVLPTSAQPALFGIDITPNLMQIKEGETQQLTAIGYDQFGNEFAITPQFSIFSGVGNINSSGLYSASAYGKATVQAKVGNKTATADFVIEETPKIRSLQIQPAKVQVVVGEGFTFAATASDQFECDFSADALNYYTTDANATMAGSTFSSEMPGDYLVVVQSGTIKDTAEVRVDYIANINLAFLKPVAATSYENAGTLPEYVNDGDPATRWGSAFSDPQTIEIDLLDVYKINKINLLWEAAYATRYRVEVSADEETWEAVYTENAGTGGAKMINFAETEARFVRVTTLARATQYGASLFEIEVYGTERVPTEITNVFNNNSDNIIIKNIGKKLMVEGENLQKISIYNIQGVLLNKFILKENKNYFETTINFADGIYLVVVKTNENQMVRKIIFK